MLANFEPDFEPSVSITSKRRNGANCSNVRIERACVDGVKVEANSVYALSGGEFKLYTGTELPAGKAYLLASDVPGNAPTLSFDFGGDVTGISTIDNGQQTTDNRWYDLSGRRVENPTKGMYIHNGKKVIVK